MNKRGLVLVALIAALAMLGAACTSNPTSGGPSADCTNPPSFGPGARLQGCSLVGFDLSGINLSGSNLSGADLSGSNLEGANLAGANLEGANLSGANLTGANLTGAILSGAILLGALFLNAVLDGALFGFGKVFGPTGLGGAAPTTAAQCVGEYCPGYNSSNDNTTDWICRNTPDSVTGEYGVPVAFSSEQLAASGERSVVTDSATDFSGASFVGLEEEGPTFQGLDLREANFENTTWSYSIFACHSLDGARFAGSSFERSEMHHISAHEADFSNVDFFSSLYCDIDFIDTSFVASTWQGLSALACAELIPQEELDLLPDPLSRFDGSDFSDAVIGGVADPDRGGWIGFTHNWGGFTRSVSMVGVTLDGATIDSAAFNRADLSGSSADGASFVGGNVFTDVTFPATGWENATFTGSPNFDGALCPNGSTGSGANPCFAVTP